MTGVDQILKHYIGGAQATAYRPHDPLGVAALLHRAPKRVIDAIASPVCAKCHQTIAARVQRTVIDGATYHPSCAARHQAREAVASTTVIGRIAGRAVLHGEFCTVFLRDGLSVFELFETGCFDGSTPVLEVDHNGSAVPGRLSFQSWREGLDFEAEIFDTPYGRETLRFVQAGECRGCSIGMADRVVRWDGRYNGERVTKARLVEISLLRAKRPSWVGTYARVI